MTDYYHVMQKAFVILLLILCVSFGEKSAAEPPQKTVFRHLGISEGFKQTNVTAMYQDETGTIWTAGTGGVSRYRGLLPEDPFLDQDSVPFLQPMNVRGIYGEQKGRIYFYQLRDVVEYDIRRETFRQLFTEQQLDGRQISAVCVRDGWLYAAAGDRVLMSGPDNEKEELLLPAMSEVSALAKHSTGDLYLGTLYSGLYRICRQGQVECVLRTGSKIISLFEDSRHNLWIGTRSEGLYRLDPQGHIRRFVHAASDHRSLADNYVRCICEDDAGRLWIGMMFGLDCYDPQTDAFYHFGRSENPLYGMRNLTVECIMKDLRGTIWFGSFYTGVSYFNPGKAMFEAIPLEGDDTTWTIVADVASDKRGNLWVATSDKGLYFYNRISGQSRFYNMSNSAIPSDNVKRVCYDAQRDCLWLGMFMGGVCVYDISSDHFTSIPMIDENGRSENTEIVHDLAVAGEMLYAGTYAGVYRIDMRSGRSEKILDLSRVFNVLVDEQYLYVVTGQTNFRVYHLDGTGHYQPEFSQIIRGNMITSLFRDSKGRIWIGTTRSGALLYEAEQQRFRCFDKASCGLESNHVSSISETSEGWIVLGTNAGLSLLDMVREKSENYNAQGDFPLLSLENGCLRRSTDGVILCGGVDGLAAFDAKEATSYGRSPQIYFASLAVNEQIVHAGDRTGILQDAMPYTRAISLRHRHSLVNISLGTDNSGLFNVRDYQYKLEGFDENWRVLDGRTIRYMNLPPGHYTLSVRSRPTKLFGEVEPIHLDIRAYPPLYASVGAYVFYVLLIMGVTALVFRAYYARKQLEHSLAMERMEKEHQNQVTQWKLVFFTNISHEFRTPLTLILGQLDLIVRQQLPVTLQNYLMSVRRNALRLRDLVNELIDFRKQEQGYMSLKVSRQDLVGYLRDVCDAFMEYARIKEIELTYRPAMEVLPVYFDPVQLQKVFYNLISNAFKHTDKGGHIEVTLDEVDNKAVIRVRDTGHGIDPQFFDTIFERFYHHDASLQDTGVGIGLALTKGIVELHGGHIGVESEVGVGSIFTVALFCNPDFTGRNNVEVVEKQEYVKPHSISGFVPTAERIPGDDDLPQLLVVEDDEELREMFATIFSQSYRVILASNGAMGLRYARELQPDLIVSDVLMPEMSGTEMCVALKGDFATCHIPIILLTALNSLEQRITGFECGADDYVTKPFDMDELLVKCNSIVRNRRLLQKKFLESRAEPVQIESLSSNSMDEAFVSKTLKLIEEHLDSEELGIPFLCRELALSRTALFSKIKGVFGQTPVELIQNIRLREAARMLQENTDLKIIEIADRVGINSLQYFGKLFKAHFGCTPSEFRTRKR